jgi:hypothetical protein
LQIFFFEHLFSSLNISLKPKEPPHHPNSLRIIRFEVNLFSASSSLYPGFLLSSELDCIKISLNTCSVQQSELKPT